jgi:hypothetical protein
VSNYSLFYGKFCNQITDEQLDSLRELGDFEDPDACLETLNSCGTSLSTLLDSYPAFFSPDLLPVSSGDSVIFVEDNWYRVSLYEALSDIEDVSSLLDTSNWNRVCSVKNTVAPRFSDFETIWPLYSPGSSYSEGDVVFVKSTCQDAACAYIAVNDIVNSVNIDSDWQKIFCLATQQNTCSGYRRKKTPEEGYRLIKVGPGHQDYVEHPIPYKKYLCNVFKNCECISSLELNKNRLVVWFEGRVDRGVFNEEEIIENYALKIHSLTLSPEGEAVGQTVLISEPAPNPNIFEEYLNYRPSINKVDGNNILLSWEYLNIPQEFQGKTLSVYLPDPD